MNLIRLTPLILAFPLAGMTAAHAQDMRQVAQPRIPPSCVVLRARLSAPHGALAAAAERHPDTGRIQQAMDHCAAGQAVELRADGAKGVFLSGPLALRSGVTLVIDANTVLAASTNPRLYDITPGSCGLLGEHAEGCRPLLSGTGISHGGIMGAGAIDGRGGDPMLGGSVTWWQLAHQAKVLDRNQKVPGLIVLSHVHDFTMYGITLRDSPRYHVDVRDSDGFTAWGVKIMTPGTARNTDGIDPVSSTNVTIAHCFIHAGDDDVAISSRQGAAAAHISVLDNHFYTGHGMSIGSGTSGGVSHVLVRNLTIDGAQNGIRIKSDPSRGGLVQDVKYENVCIRNVTNPIVLTPHYTNFSGALDPEYRDISLRNVHVLTPGYYIFSGL
ncbi:MAG TPA: glycosyl hydrolase family 28 protein, partial [Steroidobacteraceae bacterium]|nr:glycosyl hydrolase family 28 protein [Steroidobacteraceae bacterium]